MIDTLKKIFRVFSICSTLHHFETIKCKLYCYIYSNCNANNIVAVLGNNCIIIYRVINQMF